MKAIDADSLERDGWRMSRTVQIDENTMEIQTRKPTDFPAVEPQLETDGFCADCKEYDQERHFCPRFDRVIKTTIDEIKTEQRWIPCSETIDIPDHEVLCCDKYGEEFIGWLSYLDDQWICESGGEMMYDTIAWREKPEPYGGDKDVGNMSI